MAALKVSDYLRVAERQLKQGPHPERARQDAELLLLHALDKDRSWLLTHRDADPCPPQLEAYSGFLECRHQGEPIQYITGQTEFYGLPFRVTRDVLIPRPETELLVEKVLELASSYPAPRILDVGTGSGVIAVSLAHNLPQAVITATDISPAALAIARRNAALNQAAGRVRLTEGDLIDPVREEQFEIVVSNPPYVPEADRASLAVEVRDYEPALALFAGKDGLDIYRRLIPAAFNALAPGGLLALEIGYGQKIAIAALLAECGFERCEFFPDLQGISRVACAHRPHRARWP